MSMKVNSSGDFKNIETYLIKQKKSPFTDDDIEQIAEYGLYLFGKNTPTKSGKTAASWVYSIEQTKHGIVINFDNTNIQNGLNIAILIDSGHATSTGKWYSGEKYIDKTIKQICSYINKLN